MSRNPSFYIFGEIDIEIAEKFCKWIEEQEYHKHTTLQVYVNSTGGCVFSGQSIIDAIKSCSIPVVTIVTGCAISMGFMIAISGHARVAYKGSTLMYHEFTGFTYGKHHEQVAAREWNDYLMKTFEQLVVESVKDKKKLKQVKKKLFVPSDVYLTPEEAKKLTLIDEITKVG